MRAALLLLVCTALGCGSIASWSGAPDPVPTVTVVSEVFVRSVGAEGNLRPVDATQLVTPADNRGGMKIAWLAPDGGFVNEGDVVVRFDGTEARAEHVSGEADLEVANRKLEQERLHTAQAIRERERTAALAGAEMKTTQQFQSKDEEIYSRNQIAKSEIDAELAVARMDHADKSRLIEERLGASKVALLELSRQRAQLSIDIAQSTLDKLELKAPHAGVFVLRTDRRGNLTQVGDTVWPGQRLAELPQLDHLEAEVYVLEADAAGLADGLPAEVFLDAHPGTSWPATIKKVDKLAKPRQREDSVQYFEVILSLSTIDPGLMKPGQRMHATLALGGDEAIVVPRQAIFERDGETIAWRRVGETFEPAPLQLGVSSPGRVTVLSGLSAGDEVAVRDPSRAGSPGDSESAATDGGGGGT